MIKTKREQKIYVQLFPKDPFKLPAQCSESITILFLRTPVHPKFDSDDLEDNNKNINLYGMPL